MLMAGTLLGTGCQAEGRYSRKQESANAIGLLNMKSEEIDALHAMMAGGEDDNA